MADSSSSANIRVLTLNCWGLKVVSKDRVARINAIASYLSTSPYDIVCLQELFVAQDFDTIQRALSRKLPYFKLFHGGAVGRGIATFSRYRIVAASSQPYSLNGSPLDLQGADWFAGKGSTSILVTHPILGQLQIYNTHFFSEGGDDGPEHNRAHRLINAWEFSKIVKQSAEIGRYVIAAGDFNSVPSTLPMTLVLENTGLHDAWAQLHSSRVSSLDSPNQHLSPMDAVSLYGFTYNSALNSYSSAPSQHFPTAQGKRLDYILFRNPLRTTSSSLDSIPQLVPIHAQVALTGSVPGHTFSYSDHFAVEATFTIENPELKQNVLLPDVPTYGSGPTAVTIAAAGARTDLTITPETIARVIDALKQRTTHSEIRSQWEMRGFTACVFSLAALIVGTGWSPRSDLTPVFVFVSALLTWAGTTLFYVGFLYGRWEVHLLKNAIEEMELYLQSITQLRQH